MKKLILIILYVVVFIVNVHSQKLTYTESSIVGTLNPYGSSTLSHTSERLYSLIYEPLLRYNHSTMEFENVLIDKIINKGDGFVRLNLKKNVKWHDGEEFTSDDVIFTYNYINEKYRVVSRKIFYEGVLIRRISDHEIDITVKGIDMVNGDDYKNYLNTWIIPEHLYDKDTLEPNSPRRLNTNPVGTGLYKFVRRSSQSDIILSQNDDYHSKTPLFKELQMERLADEDSQIQRLLAENTDLLIKVPPTQIDVIESANNVRLEAYQSYKIEVIGFNFRNQHLKRKVIRQAITIATNRDRILKQWYADRGEVLPGPFTRGSIYYNPDVEPLKYSVSEARRMLSEAGYTVDNDQNIRVDRDGTPLSLRLLVKIESGGTNQTVQQVTQDFVEMMEEIGIRIIVDNRVIDEYEESRKTGDFDLILTSITFLPSYDISSLFMTNATMNFISYSNNYIDDLLNQFLRENEIDKRNELIYRVQTVLNDESPYLFLYSLENNAAVNNKIIKVKIDPDVFFPFINEWDDISNR